MAHKTVTTRKKTVKKIAVNKKAAPKATKKANPKKSTKKYGPAAQKAVEKEMRKYKKGTARSGKTLLPVKSREQAIAIGLSKARKAGAKVPEKK